MDEQEKVELNKQKKLVDCIDNLNSVLRAFDRLEKYKARVLPIIDGFDMTHADTYIELTEDIKYTLFNIKFFSEHASKKLVEYRRICNPELDIYSIKEKKDQEKYGLTPIGDWQKHHEKMQRLLNKIQPGIDKVPEKRKLIKSEEVKSDDLEDLKEKLEIASKNKQEKQIETTKRIDKIEFKILRLEWAMLLLFVLQISVLIKLVIH